MENTKESLAGKILIIGDSKYKIYHADKDFVYFCMLETSRLILFMQPIEIVREEIIMETYKVIDGAASIAINEGIMTENELKIFKAHKTFMNDVEKGFGPDFLGLKDTECKKEFCKIYNRHNITKKTAWKIVRHYLQAGRCDEGLVDKRMLRNVIRPYNYTKKTGRPFMGGSVVRGIPITDEINSIFNKYMKKALKNKSMTFRKSYEVMIENEFSYHSDDGSITPYPEAERPTENQYYYYIKAHTTKEERDMALLGAKEVRNNKRILIGSAREEVIRPGQIVEVDTVEADLSLVSEVDRSQCIGRGIVYFAVDVLSGAIVAVSTGIENNSVLGVTSMMLNLLDDKVDYAAEYNIEFTRELWPTNFLPETFRTDFGSDYISKELQRICKNIGIELETVSPGTGSLKPIVERSFHSFQDAFRASTEGKGLIVKRHDSNHHAQSCMTMNDFTKLVIAFVTHYNQKANESRVLGKELIENKILPIPIKIWDFYGTLNGAPEQISADRRKELYYTLMPEARASISIDGITFKGLKYFNKTPELAKKMFETGRKRIQIKILYDPRSVNCIYYVNDDGKYETAFLNEKKEAMRSFAGMTFMQYEQYVAETKKMKHEMKNHNLATNIALDVVTESIVKNAERLSPPEKSNTKKMREARAAERHMINSQNRISKHLGIEEPDIDDLIDTDIRETALEFKPYDSLEDARLTEMANYYNTED